MQSVVNVIDTGVLLNLAGIDELDLLTAAGRKVVITQQVIDEATRDPDHPNTIKRAVGAHSCAPLPCLHPPILNKPLTAYTHPIVTKQ